MKTAELQALGLSQEQIDAVFRLNGIDVENAKASKEKALTDLTTERDDLRTRLTDAETTLKGFEGIDPAKMQSEIDAYKRNAEEAEASYNQQITQRDQRDWLKAKLDEYGVVSPYARKQLETECMSADSGLVWRDGRFLGFDDYMTAAKEKDASLYVTAAEKEAAEKAAALKEKAPTIVGPTGAPATSSEHYKPPMLF